MIAIDVTPCCGQATGVGRYVQDLVSGYEPQKTIAVFQGHHGTPPASLLTQVAAHARYDFLGGRIGARLRLGKILKTNNCSLYHSTSTIAVPGSHWSGTVVTTIHDCHALDIQQSVSARSRRLFRSLLHAQFKRSQLIITPSTHSADAVRAHGWQGPLHVIPHGVLPAVPTTRPAQAPTSPYVLTLGAIAPTKGLSIVAQAVRQIPDLPWIHIGPVRYDPGHLIQNDMHKSGCTLLGYVSDAEREAWLAHAWVLCQPSQAEGFGYPPLEALVRGVPVIARRAGALPEVLGDAALWLKNDNDSDNDNDSASDCVAALRTLQKDTQLYNQLVAAARARAAQFTHRRMIEAHHAAYREASQCASR